MKLKFLLTPLPLLLAACASDVEQPQAPTIAQSSSNKISLEDALRTGEKAMNAISPSTQTRSPRTVKSVNYLRVSKTRAADSELPDTIMYVVNYGDNEGFAILSADKRALPVYAISDQGSISAQEIRENKSLALCVNRIAYDCANRIRRDSIYPVNPGLDDPTPVDFTKKVGPWLTQNQTVWAQTAPYNRFCPILETGERAVVGCSAVSVAMILSYFEYPTSYISGGTVHNYNWETIKANPHSDDLALLLRDLGLPELLNMNYVYEKGIEDPHPDIYSAPSSVGMYYSAAERDSLIPTFKKLGYTVPDTLQSFTNNVPTALNQAPILIAARDASSFKGHAWVIDGYIEEIKVNSISPLFHCLWGWGGKANGYFYLGDDPDKNEYGFNTSTPIIIDEGSEPITNGPCYDDMLQYVGGFSR